MRNKIWMMLVLTAATVNVAGCVPVAIGAVGAVAADKAVENKEGGDGLF